MSYWKKSGTLINGSVTLINGTLNAVIYAGVSTTWADIYSIVVSTDETATETITVSDGTTTLTYFTGGSGSPNPPIVDQSDVPVRFKKGANITVTANAVTAGKHIAVNIRGLATTT